MTLFLRLLLPLGVMTLSGCGLTLTHSASDTVRQPAPKPAPIEYRDSDRASVSQAASHTVKRGDTLYAIARRYQRTVSDLAVWNTLAPPYTLYPGQVLRVGLPAGSEVTPNFISPLPARRDQTPTRRLAPNFNSHKAQVATPAQATCLPQPGQWRLPSLGRMETTQTRNGRQGINIFGQLNQAVVATASGQVIYSGAGVNGYESSLIIIQHTANWLSVYSHTRNRRVSNGQFVSAGQTIAEMGLDLQNRAVLHFELSCNGKTVNPLSYLAG